MSTPLYQSKLKGYEIIAIYHQNDEEREMLWRAKQDALRRGRKCVVTLQTKGPHAGKYCLWMPKKFIKKSEK